MPISLSGLYEGTDARDYVVLQDDADTPERSMNRVQINAIAIDCDADVA